MPGVRFQEGFSNNKLSNRNNLLLVYGEIEGIDVSVFGRKISEILNFLSLKAIPC